MLSNDIQLYNIKTILLLKLMQIPSMSHGTFYHKNQKAIIKGGLLEQFITKTCNIHIFPNT